MRIFLLYFCFISLLLPMRALSQSHSTTRSVGYALDLQKITKERMQYAKSLGIDYIEISGLGAVFNKDLGIKNSKAYWKLRLDSVKQILDEAGIQVWSIHMPFSKQLDLSLADEEDRKHMLAAQVQLLKLIRRVAPKVILFHPSYYLEPEGRSHRKDQLVKSVKKLDKVVHAYGMQLVIENMLGPTLLVADKARPLLRTIAECQELFQRFPDRVGIAVDMCHIASPEQLLLAFGKRVKTLHVSDGDGSKESHYLPCNDKGENDWNAIFKALDQIGYEGVFMYECKYNDERELTDCYQLLQQNYLKSL